MTSGAVLGIVVVLVVLAVVVGVIESGVIENDASPNVPVPEGDTPRLACGTVLPGGPGASRWRPVSDHGEGAAGRCHSGAVRHEREGPPECRESDSEQTRGLRGLPPPRTWPSSTWSN